MVLSDSIGEKIVVALHVGSVALHVGSGLSTHGHNHNHGSISRGNGMLG